MYFLVIIAVIALLYIFFDVHYFIRGYMGRILAPIRKKYWPKQVLEEVVRYGMFTTTDLGFWWMMSPSRYMRECDFARFDMFDETLVFDAILKLKGGIYCGGLVVKYMTPLKLFDTYLLKSRIVCWDEEAFYVEQIFERRRDHEVAAVVHVRMPLWNTTPSQVVKEVAGKHVSSPNMPSQIWSLARSNEATMEDFNKNK